MISQIVRLWLLQAVAIHVLGGANSHISLSEVIIIIRFSCLEARCVCRQAAVKAAKILPLQQDSPDPSKTQSNVATVLSNYTAPRQPGP